MAGTGGTNINVENVMEVSDPVATSEEAVVWEWEWVVVLVTVMVCLLWVAEGIEVRTRTKNGFKAVLRVGGGSDNVLMWLVSSI